MPRNALATNLTARQRQTYGKRLLRLEAYLAALPRKAYDHSAYIRKQDACGTVGCALGHAVTSKLFRGLKIKVAKYGYSGDVSIMPVDFNDNNQNAADAYFGPGTYDRVFASFAYWGRGRAGVGMVRTRLREVAAKRFGVVATA